MKNVLIIAGEYFPFATPCAFRMHSFAKHLSRFGYQPYILSLAWTIELIQLNEYFGIGAFDSSYSQKDICPIVKITSPSKNPSFLNRLLFDISGLKLHPSLQKSCQQAIQKIWRKNTFKAVIATTPQFSWFDSFKLARWVSKSYNVPWIADFRDVEGQNYSYPKIAWKDLSKKPGRVIGQILHPLRSKIRSTHEISLCKTAFACTTVSEGLVTLLKSQGLSCVNLLINGYEPDEYRHIDSEKTVKFRILYAGALHWEQNPSLLFDALDQIIREKHDSFIQSLDLIFHGVTREALDPYLKGRACRGLVQCFPRIPKKNIQRKMKGSAILLHLSHGNAKGIMTSKITEYLGAGRPIMTIPGDNDVVDAFLKDTNAGVSLKAVDEIKAYLLKQFEYWRSNGDIFYEADPIRKDVYTREHQVQILANLLNEAIDKTPFINVAAK